MTDSKVFITMNKAYLKILAAFVIVVITFVSSNIPASAVVIKDANISLSIVYSDNNSITVSAILTSGSVLNVGGLLFDIRYNKNAFKFNNYIKSNLFNKADIALPHTTSDNYRSIRFAYESETIYGISISSAVTLFSATFDITDFAGSMTYDFIPEFGDIGEFYEAGILMTPVNCTMTQCSFEVNQELCLSDSKINMIEHTRYKIAANKQILNWYSSNAEVADVNKDGVISARQPGRCFIGASTGEGTVFCTVTVSERTAVSAQIVQVQDKQYYCKNQEFVPTGIKLSVTFDSEETEVITDGFSCDYDFSTQGSKQVIVKYQNVITSVPVTVMDVDMINSDVYDVNNNYILGIAADLSVSTFKSNMKNSNIYIVDGSKIVSDGTVATGMVATIYADSHLLDDKTIIVNGDVNSDSKSDVRDLVVLKKSISGMKELSVAQSYAANSGKTSELSAQSLITLRQILLVK